jgi:hypothetical protein
MTRLFLVAMCAVMVAGCGEINQTKTAGNTNRSDTAAWQGGNSKNVAAGWQPGNRTSWESQLRTRAQNQNEYQKIN